MTGFRFEKRIPSGSRRVPRCCGHRGRWRRHRVLGAQAWAVSSTCGDRVRRLLPALARSCRLLLRLAELSLHSRSRNRIVSKEMNDRRPAGAVTWAKRSLTAMTQLGHLRPSKFLVAAESSVITIERRHSVPPGSLVSGAGLPPLWFRPQYGGRHYGRGDTVCDMVCWRRMTHWAQGARAVVAKFVVAVRSRCVHT